MMGWVIVAVLAAATMLGLYLSKRCSRLALELVGAIVLIGVAGYGWQGNPDMAGSPVSQRPAPLSPSN